jgi:hypothetical protein
VYTDPETVGVISVPLKLVVEELLPNTRGTPVPLPMVTTTDFNVPPLVVVQIPAVFFLICIYVLLAVLPA